MSILGRALFLVASLAISGEVSIAQFGFSAPRALPMPFAEKRQADLACDNDGAGSSLAKRRSNHAKNNFTAPAPAIPLTFDDFRRLQTEVDNHPETFHPRTTRDGYDVVNRAILRDLITVNSRGRSIPIGEGKRVVLVAYVMSARHANSHFTGGAGESVNCNSPRMNKNDIHIELIEKPGDIGDTEKRLTAEITPHFRPIIWERFDTDDRTAPHVVDIPNINGDKPLRGKPGIKGLVGEKVRIYGQLFFDDVHQPCREMPCSRLSTWEIHPVYAIDIQEDGEWIPFHEWAATR